MKYILIPDQKKIVAISELTIDPVGLTITVLAMSGLTYLLTFDTIQELLEKLDDTNSEFCSKQIFEDLPNLIS